MTCSLALFWSSVYIVNVLCAFVCLQTEIAKRLNAILAQVIPFLSQEVRFIFGFFLIVFVVVVVVSATVVGLVLDWIVYSLVCF